MKNAFFLILLVVFFVAGTSVCAGEKTAVDSAKAAVQSVSNTTKEVGHDIARKVQRSLEKK
jgi:TATA-box binding protein (TBP) (component of TFIID and TFIIIB)